MTPATIEAAIKAPMHPALRWRPVLLEGDKQHRRGAGDHTACGLPGPLTLAEADLDYCTACYGSPR